MGRQRSGKLYTAAEVMAGLKGKKGMVEISFPRTVGSGGVTPQRPQTEHLRDLVLAQFATNLLLENCTVARHKGGEPVRGSVLVVAVVPTAEDTDSGL